MRRLLKLAVLLVALGLGQSYAAATIRTITGAFMFPTGWSVVRSSSFNTYTLNANGEALAYIFASPQTGSIAKLGFRTGTVTTGATIDVRLETVDATNGEPSGSLVCANANASQVVADADDNVFFTVTLTTPCAVTRGQFLAANAVTNGGNLLLVSINNPFPPLNNMPYINFNNGAWTRDDKFGVGYVEYSDGSTTPFGVLPLTTINTEVVGQNTTPDEVGNRFTLPFPMRVSGVYDEIDMDADIQYVLYDSDGTTVLATATTDDNIDGGITGGRQTWYQPFTTSVTLLANTTYRIVVKPTTATTVDITTVTVPTATHMNAFDGGTSVYYTSRTDAGGWTDTTTKRTMIGLAVEGFDDGDGSVKLYDTTLYDATIN